MAADPRSWLGALGAVFAALLVLGLGAGAVRGVTDVAAPAAAGGSATSVVASTPSSASPDLASRSSDASLPVANLALPSGSSGAAERAGPHPQDASDPRFINVSNSPGLEVYDAATGDVYVLDWDAAKVSVLSGSTRVGSVDVGSGPFNGAYDAGNGYVYVTDLETRNVSVIDGTTLEGTVGVGTLPLSATYDSADGYVYVTNGPSDNVSVLSGTTVVTSVNVGSYPFASTYDSAKGWVYVTNWDSGTVTVIDGTTVEGTVTVGTEPYSAAYDAENGYVYVMNRYSGTVSVIDGLTVVATLKVGAADVATGFNTTFIDSALYDGVNGYVYALDSAFESDNVTVIDGTTILGTVILAPTPFAPGYSTATGTVYVPDSASDNVSVIGGTAYLGSLNVGLDPDDALFDSQDGDVYVTNYLSNNVSVIVPENSIHIAETGLPKGTSWSVTLNGTTQTTVAASITFTVPNGSYGYEIGEVPEWHQTNFPSHGTFTVSGASVTKVTLVFTCLACEVTFEVIGLPAHTNWSATFNGTTRYSNGTSITFIVPNGTYGYKVADVSGSPPIVQSGSLTVSSPPVVIKVTFVSVTFTEKGLPPKGKRWSVGLDGFLVKTSGTAKTATAASLHLYVFNGTYTYVIAGPAGYVVAPASKAVGTLKVAGKSLVENLTFEIGPTYSLSFHEVGLAPGSNWCVTIGSTVCSTKATVVFKNLTARNYSYAIGPIQNATTLVKVGTAWVVEAGGTVAVSKGTTLQVRFAYPVTFKEMGLIAPFTWSVTSEGETGTSPTSTATIVLYLTNGSQAFSVHPVSGYLRSPVSGHLMVSGQPANVSVAFKPRDVSGPAVAAAPFPGIGVTFGVIAAARVG